MIQSGEIEGYIQGNTFVRTKADRMKGLKKPKDDDIRRVPRALEDLLRGTNSVDVEKLEKETGVDSRILRRTLIILLGEELIDGTLEGNEFVLGKDADARQLAQRMLTELKNWSV
jgi:hypothetical protein